MSTAITNILGKFGRGPGSLIGGLAGGKYTFKNLTYPDDINNIGGGVNHCMMFNIYVRESSKSAQTKPTTGTTTSNILGSGINSLVGGIKGSAAVNAAKQVIPTSVSNFVGSVVNNLVELKESIVLYIPHELQTNDSQDWQEDSFATSEYLAQSTDSLDALKRFATNTAVKYGQKKLARLGATGEEFTNAASKISGRIINPFYELLYGGTGFRTFNFNFKFTPQTQKEAETVRNIIHTFRYHQAPEIDDTITGGRFLLYPSEFRIQYISYGEENQFINKVGRCVLTQISTNYTGSNVSAFHSDGSPISYTLSLTFKELEIITKEKIGVPGEGIGL